LLATEKDFPQCRTVLNSLSKAAPPCSQEGERLDEWIAFEVIRKPCGQSKSNLCRVKRIRSLLDVGYYDRHPCKMKISEFVASVKL
jgi:hypothetical protein